MSSHEPVDEADGRPRSRSISLLLVALAVGVGLLLVIAVIVGGTGLFSVRKHPAPVDVRGQVDFVPHQPEHPVKSNTNPSVRRVLMSRDDFESAVRDRDPKEAIAAVGHPDEVQVPPAGPEGPGKPAEKWIFRKRVTNPETGRPYRIVVVLVDVDRRPYGIEYPE